jgi:hypothetical protein
VSVPELGVTSPQAGAVWAEQREDLARLDIEVDALQRLESAVVDLADLPQLDHRHVASSRLARRT